MQARFIRVDYLGLQSLSMERMPGDLARGGLLPILQCVSPFSRNREALVGRFHVKRKVSFRRWPHLLLPSSSFLCLFPHAQEPSQKERTEGRAAAAVGGLIRTRMHMDDDLMRNRVPPRSRRAYCTMGRQVHGPPLLCSPSFNPRKGIEGPQSTRNMEWRRAGGRRYGVICLWPIGFVADCGNRRASTPPPPQPLRLSTQMREREE